MNWLLNVSFNFDNVTFIKCNISIYILFFRFMNYF